MIRIIDVIDMIDSQNNFTGGAYHLSSIEQKEPRAPCREPRAESPEKAVGPAEIYSPVGAL